MEVRGGAAQSAAVSRYERHESGSTMKAKQRKGWPTSNGARLQRWARQGKVVAPDLDCSGRRAWPQAKRSVGSLSGFPRRVLAGSCVLVLPLCLLRTLDKHATRRRITRMRGSDGAAVGMPAGRSGRCGRRGDVCGGGCSSRDDPQHSGEGGSSGGWRRQCRLKRRARVLIIPRSGPIWRTAALSRWTPCHPIIHVVVLDPNTPIAQKISSWSTGSRVVSRGRRCPTTGELKMERAAVGSLAAIDASVGFWRSHEAAQSSRFPPAAVQLKAKHFGERTEMTHRLISGGALATEWIWVILCSGRGEWCCVEGGPWAVGCWLVGGGCGGGRWR